MLGINGVTYVTMARRTSLARLNSRCRPAMFSFIVACSAGDNCEDYSHSNDNFIVSTVLSVIIKEVELREGYYD